MKYFRKLNFCFDKPIEICKITTDKKDQTRYDEIHFCKYFCLIIRFKICRIRRKYGNTFFYKKNILSILIAKSQQILFWKIFIDTTVIM